jgi:phosphate transport system permease protein
VLLHILLPKAMPGILAGAMLALGRALGETMAVTMVIGNANQLNPSLLAPANTIASLLANQFAEAQDIQVAALMYAALVLFAITLVVNWLAEGLIQSIYGER